MMAVDTSEVSSLVTANSKGAELSGVVPSVHSEISASKSRIVLMVLCH